MAKFPCPACGAERSTFEADCTSCPWKKHGGISVKDYKSTLINQDESLDDLIKSQKTLIYSVIFGVVAQFIIPLLFLSIPYSIYAIIKITGALKITGITTIILILLMFIPIVNIICILILNGKATAKLEKAGIRVGMFGA
ncbi:MAG: hypothetical protein A2485_09650 [Bdellovibrionales bacterium RIFOXYC12_FULL_39_17]|nr:MAG: hypothetical protein A2485_09650 [Bdellovibrionales bacterium RIFOXYC12_FULL_39_17]